MATTEHTINDALAEALRRTRHIWQEPDVITSESTSTLRAGGGRPDILVTEPNVSPVVIETEIMPALTVESEAMARLVIINNEPTEQDEFADLVIRHDIGETLSSFIGN